MTLVVNGGGYNSAGGTSSSIGISLPTAPGGGASFAAGTILVAFLGTNVTGQTISVNTGWSTPVLTGDTSGGYTYYVCAGTGTDPLPGSAVTFTLGSSALAAGYAVAIGDDAGAGSGGIDGSWPASWDTGSDSGTASVSGELLVGIGFVWGSVGAPSIAGPSGWTDSATETSSNSHGKSAGEVDALYSYTTDASSGSWTGNWTVLGTGTYTLVIPVKPADTATSVNASYVAGTASIPSGQPIAGSSFTASAVTGVASIPAPGIKIGASLSPSAVSGSAAIPGPSITAGSLLGASAVAGTASVPNGNVNHGATAVATVVAGTVTVPGPVIHVDAPVTSAAVSGTASVPAPSITAESAGGGSANVSPASVSARCVIYTARLEHCVNAGYVGAGGSTGIQGTWSSLANAEGSGTGTYASGTGA